MWNRGFCTWWWDEIFNVDISLSCMSHDQSYRKCSYIAKLRSDVALGLDVWALSSLADNWYERVGIKCTAVLMTTAVLTVGNLFWSRKCLYQ